MNTKRRIEILVELGERLQQKDEALPCSWTSDVDER